MGDSSTRGAGPLPRQRLGAERHAALLALIADGRGVPVVAEDLDFRREKAWLRQYGKRSGSVLSLFRTKRLLTAVERQCRRRGVEVVYVDQALSTRLAEKNRYPARCRIGFATPRRSSSGGAVPDLPSVCRQRPGPRARRSEAPRYARLGEHARAVVARWLAPWRPACGQQGAGDPRGPRRVVFVPARWAPGRLRQPGCRWPGECGSFPYSRLTRNGRVSAGRRSRRGG